MTEARDRHISAIDGVADFQAELPLRDVGDLRSVKAAEKETKTVEQIRMETVRSMMGDSKSRKWFFDLLLKCHIGSNPFSPDPIRMSFACGELNIGQQVFADLQAACPDLYLQMMDENR